MKEIEPFADKRLVAACVYCGLETENKDHVPSRVFLDKPFPEYSPHVPSCKRCNESFSLDEEYLACIIECVCAGTVNEDNLERERVRRAIKRRPAIKARLEKAQVKTGKGVIFDIEDSRVSNIVLKLAKGHIAYELSETTRQEPFSLTYAPLCSLGDEAREHYEVPPAATIFPEVGSRGMQRMLGGQDMFEGWVIVQPNRYRFLAHVSGSIIMVRFVIREYLACEVIWNEV